MNIRVGGTKLNTHGTAIGGEHVICDIEPVVCLCGGLFVVKGEDHELSLCRVVLADTNDSMRTRG